MQGFEVNNNQGSFQVTTETRVLAYLRKGTKKTQAYSSNSASSVVKVALNPATEVIAFKSNVACSVLFHNGSEVVISADTARGNPVNISYWVFGRPTTTSSQGIQVFDGGGTNHNNLLYDSSWIPIKPIGIVSRSLTLSSNKTYAAIPINFKSAMKKIYSEILAPGGRTDVMYICDRVDAGVKLSPSSADVVDFHSFFENRTTFNGSLRGRTYNFSWDNSATTQYLIIDVTGL